MPPRIVTFTSLYPSSFLPTHGVFVRERMRRVTAALGWEREVVSPVPWVPPGLRRGDHRLYADAPSHEVHDGESIHHPAYLHIPGLSESRQARREARGSAAIVRELVADRVALLDAHYVYPDGVAALALARELGVPCFVTARGTDVLVLGDRPRVASQIRAACTEATGLFAVSDELARKLCAVTGLPADRIEVVRNGVDLERFRPGDPAAARAGLGLPAAGRLVCAVGGLIDRKGFHLVADALHSLPSDVELVVVGRGPDRDRIAAAGPTGRVRFLGALPPDGVAQVFRACDLMVLPTAREGWPNVVTEALASGLPVVASPVAAIPEMVTGPEVGALVARGDRDGLVRAILRLLDCPPDRNAIRRHAEGFSWDQPVSIIADRFRAALGH